MTSLFFPRVHRGHLTRTPRYTQPSSYGPLATNNWGMFNNDFQPFLNLFDDTFKQLEKLSSDAQTNTALNWSPNFDVKETKEAYQLEGEMPGVDQKNLTIEFVDDMILMIKGHTEHVREEGTRPQLEASKPSIEGATRTAAPTSDQPQASVDPTPSDASNTPQSTDIATSTDTAKPQHTYWLSERSTGSFQRSFSFPAAIDHDAVKASLKNGILKLTIPKLERKPEPETRRVQIEAVEE